MVLQNSFFSKSENKWKCKKCSSDNVSKRRREIKRILVDYKGGKCEKCGYDKCIDALEFHHIDKNEKNFGISNGNCKSLEVLKKKKLINVFYYVQIVTKKFIMKKNFL